MDRSVMLDGSVYDPVFFSCIKFLEKDKEITSKIKIVVTRNLFVYNLSLEGSRKELKLALKLILSKYDYHAEIKQALKSLSK